MQYEMFPVQAQAVAIRLVLNLETGWDLSVAVRREGDRWGDDGVWTHYSYLSSREALDVLSEELSRALLDV